MAMQKVSVRPEQAEMVRALHARAEAAMRDLQTATRAAVAGGTASETWELAGIGDDYIEVRVPDETEE